MCFRVHVYFELASTLLLCVRGHDVLQCPPIQCIDDGQCDGVCNNAACSFDGGDCGPNNYCAPSCLPHWIGTHPKIAVSLASWHTYAARALDDGVCDGVCNNLPCQFDGADCGSSFDKALCTQLGCTEPMLGKPLSVCV